MESPGVIIFSIIFCIVFFLFMSGKISFKSPSGENSKYFLLVGAIIILLIVVILAICGVGVKN